MCEWMGSGSDQIERSADAWTTHFGGSGFSSASLFDFVLFGSEVVKETCTGSEEEKASFEVEWANRELIFC